MSLILVASRRCLKHSCVTPYNMPLMREDCDSSASTDTGNATSSDNAFDELMHCFTFRFILCVRVCMCVCICVDKDEREREKDI